MTVYTQLSGAISQHPLSGQDHGPVHVCVAKEWYRFPSSFFLPKGCVFIADACLLEGAICWSRSRKKWAHNGIVSLFLLVICCYERGAKEILRERERERELDYGRHIPTDSALQLL